jgi:hypothetical protein
MIKLINYQYLRNEVDISQNVPDKELDNPIKRAHEMLEMIIGDDLYNEIVSQYQTVPSTLSAANTTLFPYVQQFLAWQAYQFWIPKANFKDTKSGFRIMQEDNSVAATEKDMATLIRDIKMWAQTKKEKLVQFLEDNYESYPLYDYNCSTNKRTGTGFHITSVGKHKPGCGCNSCRYGHIQ